MYFIVFCFCAAACAMCITYTQCMVSFYLLATVLCVVCRSERIGVCYNITNNNKKRIHKSKGMKEQNYSHIHNSDYFKYLGVFSSKNCKIFSSLSFPIFFFLFFILLLLLHSSFSDTYIIPLTNHHLLKRNPKNGFAIN